jgi:threonylcarbamoyladenosine tRNA methylthiotransferase MtaB
LIELAAVNEKILPHFHIPLQSGCNKILGLMRRMYNTDMFASKVRMIRKKIPSAGIGADVIVGFPGESAADFEDTYAFLEDLPFTYLHIFAFSGRPDTAAAKMADKVPDGEKESRSKKLIALSGKKHMEFCKMNIDQETKVLFENTRTEGFITGFTSNYIRVEHPWQSKLAGQIKRVKLNSIASSGRISVELID